MYEYLVFSVVQNNLVLDKNTRVFHSEDSAKEYTSYLNARIADEGYSTGTPVTFEYFKVKVGNEWDVIFSAI